MNIQSVKHFLQFKYAKCIWEKKKENNISQLIFKKYYLNILVGISIISHKRGLIISPKCPLTSSLNSPSPHLIKFYDIPGDAEWRTPKKWRNRVEKLRRRAELLRTRRGISREVSNAWLIFLSGAIISALSTHIN